MLFMGHLVEVLIVSSAASENLVARPIWNALSWVITGLQRGHGPILIDDIIDYGRASLLIKAQLMSDSQLFGCG